jgi:hypothetical protein
MDTILRWKSLYLSISFQAHTSDTGFENSLCDDPDSMSTPAKGATGEPTAGEELNASIQVRLNQLYCCEFS